MNILFKSLILSFALLLSPVVSNIASAENLKTVKLPDPMPQFKKHDNNLSNALEKRMSTRDYKDTKLNINDLSAILWSANGVSRKDGKRTIPVPTPLVESIVLYVLDADGVWLYDAKNHSLIQKSTKDIRLKKDKVPTPAITLVYALNKDVSKMELEKFYVGSMYQNVALYCASANLGNIVLGGKPAIDLPKNEELLIIQSVGVKK